MNRKDLQFYGVLLVVGLIGTWITYNYWIAFSDYFIALLQMVIFAGLFHWYDAKALESINTLEEIKNGNTAVSQFLIAVAILLHAVAMFVS